MKLESIQLLQRLIPLLFIAALLVVIGVGAGCNTAHGFGQDMEKAGEKIQDGTQ